VEGAGTKLDMQRQVHFTNANCLEEPCSAVIGALSELIGLKLEAIWWYRKHKAENVQISVSYLPVELLTFLQESSAIWSSVSNETRLFCIETLSSKPYDVILKLQTANLEKIISITPKTFEIVHIPIVTTPKISSPMSLLNYQPTSIDMDYAAQPPTTTNSSSSSSSSAVTTLDPSASVSPLMDIPSHMKRSTFSPGLASPPNLHSLSTIQFLERSRRNLELSVALPSARPSRVPLIDFGSVTSATNAATTTNSHHHQSSLSSSTELPSVATEAKVISIPIGSGSGPGDTHTVIVHPSETIPSPTEIISAAAATAIAAATQQQQHHHQNQNQHQEPVIQETIQERLKRRISLFGLVEHKQVPGDGNCQFSSLSDQLYRDFAHAAQIRAHCVAWLRLNAEMELENGAKLKEFGYNDDGWDHYCNLMSFSGTWGDHLTLVAAAELFHVRIVIVSSAADESQALIEIVPTSTGKAPQNLDVIFLCHYAEFHYGTLMQES
jgi:hypothetical protein